MFKNDHIVITGGTGFLGKHLFNQLINRGYKNITALGSKDFDLRKDCYKNFTTLRPNVVIHLSAKCGGIGGNMNDPVGYLEDNVLMNTNVASACLKIYQKNRNDFKKFIGLGSVCMYPKFCPPPFKERDIFQGEPEETNKYYGESKRLMMLHLEAMNNKYEFPAIFLIPVNLYGIYDCFEDDRSHVIPALIKKFTNAVINDDKEVICWGTGKASREFINAKDASCAIVDAMEKYNLKYPVNIGTGKEIKIKDLAEMIARIVGFQGEIVWDATKSDGQPWRQLDVSRARELFGFEAKIELENGIKEVIKWWNR